MNWKRGLKRIVSVLAIVAAVVCGLIAGHRPIASHRQAQNSIASSSQHSQIISRLEEELAKAEEMQQASGKISKSYRKLIEWIKERTGKSQTTDDPNQMLTPAIIESRQALENERKKYEALENEREKSFWYNLSTAELTGMVVLYGLGGVVAGYLGAWAVLWYGGSIILVFIHWLALGFREDESANKPKKKSKQQSLK